MSTTTKINKVLKRLELEIYAEDMEKSDLVQYLKIRGFKKIADAFFNKDFCIIGETMHDNGMLSYSDILDVIVTATFYINN